MLKLSWVGLKYNQVYPYKEEPEGNFMTHTEEEGKCDMEAEIGVTWP